MEIILGLLTMVSAPTQCAWRARFFEALFLSTQIGYQLFIDIVTTKYVSNQLPYVVCHLSRVLYIELIIILYLFLIFQ